MSRQKYPSDEKDQFMVRLPEGFRDRIADLAKANGRSMNAEITVAIEQYLSGKTDDAVLRRLYALEARVSELEEVRRHASLDASDEDIKLFKEARASQGLSQAELAELAGTSQQTIDRIERGITKHSKAIPAIRRILEARA